MAEAGVDISGHRSKNVAELHGVDFDVVVTVCGHANERCPRFQGKTKVIHGGFDDPPRWPPTPRPKRKLSPITGAFGMKSNALFSFQKKGTGGSLENHVPVTDQRIAGVYKEKIHVASE
jgi:hypothetical protein